MAEQLPTPAYLYNEHARNVAPDDYWGQVKRTVNGKPVGQDQIDMIVAAMLTALDLAGDDELLDLCCGNGALTTYFFQRCRGGLGVDYSGFLIEVARRNFVRGAHEQYVMADAVRFVGEAADTARFTKALCYGAFQYLGQGEALLRDLRMRFPNVARFAIGNLPDRALAERFFVNAMPEPAVLARADTPLGIWRTREEFAAMAARAGWSATFQMMPAAFYASHYRYDAILSRA